MQNVIFNIPVFLSCQWEMVLRLIFSEQPLWKILIFCQLYSAVSQHSVIGINTNTETDHTKKQTHTLHACVHTTSIDLTQLNIEYNRRIQFWKNCLLFEQGITELQSVRHRKLRTNQYPGNNPVKLICPTFAEQQAPCNAPDMIK